MIEKGKEEVEGEAHMTMLVSISIMETPLLRCTRKSELTEGGVKRNGRRRERERKGRRNRKR